MKSTLLAALTLGAALAAVTPAASAQPYQLINLGTLGGTSSFALDINNNGLVVGISSNRVASRATLWTNGAASDLGSVDGLTSTTARAWGLNDAGSAVGLSRRESTSSVSQATLWRAGVAPLNPGSLQPDSFSQAYAINENGVIVGSAVNGQTGSGTSITQAVFWTVAGNSVSLQALGSLGRTFSEAKDINDAGQVVGYATHIAGSPQRAFIWQAGNLLDLNSLIDPASGFTLLSAEGINDRGDIVGWGTVGGLTQAYVLQAVPEPQALALMLAGMAGLGWAVRRNRKAPGSAAVKP